MPRVRQHIRKVAMPSLSKALPSNIIHIPSLEEAKEFVDRNALTLLGLTLGGLAIVSAPESGLIYAIPRAAIAIGGMKVAQTGLNFSKDLVTDQLHMMRGEPVKKHNYENFLEIE